MNSTAVCVGGELRKLAVLLITTPSLRRFVSWDHEHSSSIVVVFALVTIESVCRSGHSPLKRSVDRSVAGDRWLYRARAADVEVLSIEGMQRCKIAAGPERVLDL